MVEQSLKNTFFMLLLAGRFSGSNYRLLGVVAILPFFKSGRISY